jgi:hypothetical protein
MAFSREYGIVVDFEKLAGYSMLAVLQLRFVGSNPTPRTNLLVNLKSSRSHSYFGALHGS